MLFRSNHLINHLAVIAGVIIIDHTGHATGAREAGSVNKKNAVTGTRIYVDQTQKFTPGQPGEARLWILKDRHSKVYPHCLRMPVAFDGEREPVQRHLAGIFRLAPTATAERTVSDDEYITARLDPPTPAAVPAAAAGPVRDLRPGKETPGYMMLAEIEKAPFSSFRNAEGRMQARFGTGEARVRTLLNQLVHDGHIEKVEKVGGHVYTANKSAWLKEDKALIRELKAAEARRLEGSSAGEEEG